jgi:hypothetical protein
MSSPPPPPPFPLVMCTSGSASKEHPTVSPLMTVRGMMDMQKMILTLQTLEAADEGDSDKFNGSTWLLYQYGGGSFT